MNRFLSMVILLFGLLTVGCGDSNLATLTGAVNVDGVAAPNGSIALIPVEGKATTTGGTIVDGQYTVQGQPARYRVEIRVSKVVGEQKLYDTPDSPVQPILHEVLPARYNDQSELEVELAAGKQSHDFDLTTK